jgi:DNA-binding transcriptional MerR regulator
MTISEVSKLYDISTDTLRYYEKTGLLPNVTRKPNGIRDYKEEDCGWVQFIKCMRGAGVQIDTLVKYIELFFQGPKTHEERKNLLIEQREKLLQKKNEIEITIEKLNVKIDNYNEIIVKGEKKILKNFEVKENIIGKLKKYN